MSNIRSTCIIINDIMAGQLAKTEFEEETMKIVDGKSYINEVRSLIVEYTQRLGRDLSFQNLEDS